MHSETAPARTLGSLWIEHPFRWHIGALFATLICAAGLILAFVNFLESRRILLDATNDAFVRTVREIEGDVERLRNPVETVVDWMSRSPLLEASSLEARSGWIPALAETLNLYPAIESIYVGYDTGDFFQLLALRDDHARTRLNAPPQAAYALQSIERAAGRIRVMHLDTKLAQINQTRDSGPNTFDPRQRPWFTEAMGRPGRIITEPYEFFATREIGQTIARRAGNGRAVAGADITLNQLSRTLTRARPTDASELALVGNEGRVLARSQPLRQTTVVPGSGETRGRDTSLPAMLATALEGQAGRRDATSVKSGGRQWLVRVEPAVMTEKGAIRLAVAIPEDEFLTEAHAALWKNLWLALALVAATVPLTWWVARRIAGNLRALALQAAAIRRLDFSEPERFRTRIVEINALDAAMASMRQTIRKFVDVTTALHAESDVDRLVARVLGEASEAAGAGGGVLYLLDDAGRHLVPASQHWRGGGSQAPDLPPQVDLQDSTHAVARAARDGQAREIQVTATPRPVGLPDLDTLLGTGPVVLIAQPLRGRSGATIGVLCLFVDGREPPSSTQLALMEAFAGAGAAALDNQRLLAAQKALFKSLIELIAGAIDAKSPYTAGHCRRVPELTNMLARAACDETTGPFADFTMDSEQWEALQIAGGLHDCGKVTTPEHVVDKATKLEAIYDRIHEVRMRFEVIKRDAEIACLKAIAQGGDADGLNAALATELRTLDEEFAFVAACNEGGEYMAPDKVERLREIGRRTWLRTLDDRLGISWVEHERKSRSPAAALPATETLLADKPEHITPREANDAYAADNRWGFKLRAPAAQANLGELHNLAIARGTLTDEDRFRINDHIVQTIVILSTLPFPRHLRSVPELAGCHHEKMDGTGYPRGLLREQMSLPARMMAVADIFEALTASDRPYKKAKTLSEAIRIMGFMKKDGHIDPDIFDLFLRSGVSRRYAERFMAPEYIDSVDISPYVGAAA